jgi:hypothetical protein
MEEDKACWGESVLTVRESRIESVHWLTLRTVSLVLAQ